jgi:hypothetical protein
MYNKSDVNSFHKYTIGLDMDDVVTRSSVQLITKSLSQPAHADWNAKSDDAYVAC